MSPKVLDLDTNYLVQEYRAGRSTSDLAREFGVSEKPISIRIKSQGIQMRGYKHHLPTELIIQRYLAGESVRKLADSYEVAHKVIDRILRQNGIEPKDSRLVQVPEEAIIQMYSKGRGVGGIAKELGTTASPIYRVLRKRGIHLRNRSEQQQIRMDNASPEQIAAQTKAANEASRGRKISFEHLCALAQIRQKTTYAISKWETILYNMLVERGLKPIPQLAIGPYNCDLALHPVAVEVWSGGWHWCKNNLAREEKRFRYIMNQGWRILVVGINLNGHSPLTPAVADYVVADIKRTRRDPSMLRKYWMVWGAGELTTGGSLEDDHFSLKPPLTRS